MLISNHKQASSAGNGRSRDFHESMPSYDRSRPVTSTCPARCYERRCAAKRAPNSAEHGGEFATASGSLWQRLRRPRCRRCVRADSKREWEHFEWAVWCRSIRCVRSGPLSVWNERPSVWRFSIRRKIYDRQPATSGRAQCRIYLASSVRTAVWHPIYFFNFIFFQVMLTLEICVWRLLTCGVLDAMLMISFIPLVSYLKRPKI